ncbi:DUF6884 domain-containing protein [Mumia quercus]|uniref:DUF6884 domain-containing protein n=1 Tax=Mumia quercus TaxID=2976125 RepID=UPI0021D0A6E7|nr:DUF6884 domain-containing protein [Mumia quercus]
MADWSPLRRLLANVDESVTLAWDELDALVGGLPKSAYKHGAFWKGYRSGWPGFTTSSVKVGESVTFVRRATTNATMPGDGGPPAVRAPDSAPDLVLVGCVKKKLDVPAPAKDLYTSTLFRKERAYAEQAGARWFVLSAEHGLVDPEQVLEPYDLRLSKTSRDYRRAWGARVVKQLGEAVGTVDGRTIEVHAGSAYADAIRGLLSGEGATVIEPLAGLTMGARLSWYGTAGDPVSTVTPPQMPDAGVAELLDRLTHADEAITPAAFLAGAGDGLRSPGLYSWWVDDEGAADLSRGLNHPIRPGLIYAGLAGATRSRSGRKSKNTLWGRIKSMHLGGRHEFSTFRLSLGSVLSEARGEVDIDEEALTAWMHEHLRLVAVPFANADTLGDVETEILAELDPPLNLDKVRRTPLRAHLSALRKSHGRRGRSQGTAAD